MSAKSLNYVSAESHTLRFNTDNANTPKDLKGHPDAYLVKTDDTLSGLAKFIVDNYKQYKGKTKVELTVKDVLRAIQKANKFKPGLHTKKHSREAGDFIYPGQVVKLGAAWKMTGLKGAALTKLKKKLAANIPKPAQHSHKNDGTHKDTVGGDEQHKAEHAVKGEKNPDLLKVQKDLNKTKAQLAKLSKQYAALAKKTTAGFASRDAAINGAVAASEKRMTEAHKTERLKEDDDRVKKEAADNWVPTAMAILQAVGSWFSPQIAFFNLIIRVLMMLWTVLQYWMSDSTDGQTSEEFWKDIKRQGVRLLVDAFAVYGGKLLGADQKLFGMSAHQIGAVANIGLDLVNNEADAMGGLQYGKPNYIIGKTGGLWGMVKDVGSRAVGATQPIKKNPPANGRGNGSTTPVHPTHPGTKTKTSGAGGTTGVKVPIGRRGKKRDAPIVRVNGGSTGRTAGQGSVKTKRGKPGLGVGKERS